MIWLTNLLQDTLTWLESLHATGGNASILGGCAFTQKSRVFLCVFLLLVLGVFLGRLDLDVSLFGGFNLSGATPSCAAASIRWGFLRRAPPSRVLAAITPIQSGQTHRRMLFSGCFAITVPAGKTSVPKRIYQVELPYDEYLGAGFLDLPMLPLNAPPNRLSRSALLPPSMLLFPLLCRDTTLPSSGLPLIELGEVASLSFGVPVPSLAIEWRLVDESESVERPNIRRRLWTEGASV